MFSRLVRLIGLALMLSFGACVHAETVTLMQGLNGYTGTTDSWFSSGSGNKGADVALKIGADSPVALVRFKIFVSEGGPVPDGATITSATLSLYKFSGSDGVFKAWRLLKNWDESQVTATVAATGTNWTTAGAGSAGNDYFAEEGGEASIGDGTGCMGQDGGPSCWLNMNVTSGVHAFAANPAGANFGWKITQLSSVGGGDKNFNSSEITNFPSLRPTLTITYTVGETVTLRDGLNSYAGTTDSWFNSGSGNKGADVTLKIGADSPSALVRFKIFVSEGGAVPDGATITSATLSLYKYSGPDGVFRAWRLLKNWDESQVTFTVAATGTNWTTGGAGSAGNDYASPEDGQGSAGDAIVDGCTAAPYPAACWLNIDVTAGVQAFAANPAANFGWKIAQWTSSGAGDKGFNSSENTGFPNLRPTLTVTYTPTEPQPPACNSGNLRPYDGAPINNTPISIAAAGATTFEAEHFNCGGQGVAYHDNVAGNNGGQFRPAEDVDLIASTDSAGGGHVIQNFYTGEWLTYTIDVVQAGTYDLAIRAANDCCATGAFHMEILGTNVTTGTVLVPVTGSLNTFQWVTKTGVALPAGQHVLKLASDQQFFHVNQLRITPSVPPATCNSGELRPYGGTPISGNPIQIESSGTTFEAEHFNCGGEGAAYHDNSAGNSGGQFRTDESVDLIVSTDSPSGGHVVNSFETGEWLAYAIYVVQGGTYDLAIRASNGGPAAAAFHVEIDGTDVTQSVSVPPTGSVDTFQWFTKIGVTLQTGPHVLKLFSDQQLFNVNQIRISPTPPPGCNSGDLRPYGGTPVEIAGSGSTTLEAEHFNCGGEGLAYHDDTSANDGNAEFRTDDGVDIGTSSEGNVVNDTRNGEWLTYTINVLEGGTYDLSIRAANSGATATFHMEIGDSDVTGGVSVSNTGSASTFQWFTKQGVELVAGPRVLKLFVDQQSFNVNQLRITRSGTPLECSGDNEPSTVAAPVAKAVPTFHSMGLYYQTAKPSNCTTTDNSGCKVWMRYRKACEPETAWRDGLPMWFDPRTGGPAGGSLPYKEGEVEYPARGSAVHLKPGTKYYFEFGTGPSSWHHYVAGTTWSEDFDVELTKKVTDGTWNCPSTGPCVITQGGTGGKYRVYDGCVKRNASGVCVEKHWINRSGAGVIEPPPESGSKTIYEPNEAHGIVVNADFVIVQNVRVTGAAMAGIYIWPDRKNVVIEDTEVWDWAHQKGRCCQEPPHVDNPNAWGEWGWNEVAAIHVGGAMSPGDGEGNSSIVIQRNIIKEPHLGAFPWDTDGTACTGAGYKRSHPFGPNGISVANAKQQIVIRYNEISGRQADPNKSHKWLNDGIGGKSNASARGSPGADSDIYQNIVMHVFDDAIEAEGGGRNVRIWGNYVNDVNAGIAAAPAHYGPHYAWRNVVNRVRKCSKWITDTDDDRDTTAAFKYNGEIESVWGGGMRYIFNNTILQEDIGDELDGAATGINSFGNGDVALNNTVARNNILHVRGPDEKPFISLAMGDNVSGGEFTHNIYNGYYETYQTPEIPVPTQWHFNDSQLTYKSEPDQPEHGPKSVPLLGGNGVGNYQQSDTSFGRRKGTHVPNFTYDIDDVDSAARSGYAPTPSASCTAINGPDCPDTGAHQYRVESGGSMKFGIDAGK